MRKLLVWNNANDSECPYWVRYSKGRKWHRFNLTQLIAFSSGGLAVDESSIVEVFSKGEFFEWKGIKILAIKVNSSNALKLANNLIVKMGDIKNQYQIKTGEELYLVDIELKDNQICFVIEEEYQIEALKEVLDDIIKQSSNAKRVANLPKILA